jgi:hypothetical protein
MPNHLEISLWSLASAPTVNDRRDVDGFDVIGKDAYALHTHEGSRIGAVIVASAWLAIYLVGAIHSLAFGA